MAVQGSLDYTACVLSLILPTYNEAANLPELMALLKGILSMPHEIIVVDDDSPDKTWEVAEYLSKDYPALRVLRRIGRRGLSSAVTEGFAMAKGDVLMVMDADLQHDPHLINKLYDAVISGADIAVASRYIEGGSVGEWVTGRRLLSKTATWLAKWIPPVHSSDPMSGFFALSNTSYERIAPHLRPTGFKILLEVLSCLPASSKLTEVPLQFQFRKYGESKLNLRVEIEFIVQLLRITLHRVQWPLFSLVTGLLCIILFLRLCPILPLYYDVSTRSIVQTSLQKISEEKGWLLSGIAVTSVQKDHFTFVYTEHYRGAKTHECYEWFYASSAPLPCEN